MSTAPSFHQLFGRQPKIEAHAPGRVNLIGEHTDYNQGFVLPIATPQETTVLLTPRDDMHVRAWSANVPEDERLIEYELGAEERRGGWADYLQGVTSALRERGKPIRGFDARISSTVPLGAGLSSSAALEVGASRALNEAFALGLDPVEIAMVAHRAETGLVGAPVGVMDQMASSLGGEDAAIFLDTRSLAFDRVPLPPNTSLIVIDSGVTHRHAGGEYRKRRAECDEAARRLGVTALRDVTPEQLPSLVLPPPLDRRVRHVVTENARVLAARDALLRGDPAAFGRLMNESHASLRDDFEVSVPQLDLLVELAQSERAVFGARMTGGGFGGSIVALAASGDAAAAAARIATQYDERLPERATVLIP